MTVCRPIDLDGRPGEYGRATAAKVHAELRKLGTVTIPAEFVFMDRAAIGLGGVFIQLGAELNWSALFRQLMADFDVDGVAARQARAGEAGLAAPRRISGACQSRNAAYQMRHCKAPDAPG